jgi:Transglycosylase SLT domain
MVEIAFGKKVNAAFKTKVVDITGTLGCDPSFLMACIAFETGERFRSNVVNKTSGATGLIQFMPKTAASLGTTTAKLAVMPEVDQLDYVAEYFSPYKNKLHSLSDVYMAILWPAAVGKPEASVMFRKPTVEYRQNSGLDTNKDGVVTKGETAAKVQAKLTRGLSDTFRG